MSVLVALSRLQPRGVPTRAVHKQGYQIYGVLYSKNLALSSTDIRKSRRTPGWLLTVNGKDVSGSGRGLIYTTVSARVKKIRRLAINPVNAELNPICHLLASLGAHHILHVSRIRVNHISGVKAKC